MQIKVTGQIGETNDFFNFPIKEPLNIHMDLSRMTYISSVGVKNWLVWSGRLPRGTKVFLEKCPFVIVSQASTVQGFAHRDKFIIESFMAPFACDDCSFEKGQILQRNIHYGYSNNDSDGWLNLPQEMTCPKCSHPMEPDFFIEKVLKILNN